MKDFLDTSIFAWFVEPYHLFSLAPYSNLVFALIVAALVATLVWLYTSLFKKRWGTDVDEQETPRLMKDFLWIGATGHFVRDLPRDRFGQAGGPIRPLQELWTPSDPRGGVVRHWELFLCSSRCFADGRWLL